MENTGKRISEVGGRHQYQKLKELKTKVERSLWFARTFGLNLCSVEVKNDAGVYHVLTIQMGKRREPDHLRSCLRKNRASSSR